MAASLFSRPFFRIYRALWMLARPLLRRSSRLADGWKERLAPDDWIPTDPARADGHAVDLWLQAASGGEARLAAAVCEQFSPSSTLRVLVTTWTRQGRDVMEKAAEGLKSSHPGLSVIVRFAPFDHPDIVRRALTLASPRMVALLETELWPGLLAACRQDHVAAPQSGALGRRVRLHLGDHQTLGIQLDADRISSRHERPPRGQRLAAERQQQAQGHQRGRYFFMKKLLHVLILSPKVSAPLSWPFRRERNRV